LPDGALAPAHRRGELADALLLRETGDDHGPLIVREAVDEFVVLDAPWPEPRLRRPETLFAAIQESQDENGTPRH
jgi:hypothetical protein